MTRARRAAVVTAAGLLFAAGVFGLSLNLAAPPSDQTRVAQFLYLLQPCITSVLGGYLAVRRSSHPAGWWMLLIAASSAVSSLAKGALHLDLGGAGGAAAGGVRSWAAWLDNWTWVSVFAAIGMLLLTFPTGHLPSRRWRPVAAALAVVAVGDTLLCMAVRTNVHYPDVTLPQRALPHLSDSVSGVVFLPLLAALAAAAASLFVRRRRYRRTGDLAGSAQVRWLMWAAGVVVVTLAVGGVVDANVPPGSVVNWATDVVSQAVFYGFPVAVVVAITRHGLFEIDKVVSRTVTYALVTGLLLGAYVGIIAGLSALLPPDVNSLVVAVATLAVAALFVPLRRRVQRRVDRRFNRRRHDRAGIVDRFAEVLRRDPGTTAIGDELVDVVGRVLEPAHTSVWLVPR